MQVLLSIKPEFANKIFQGIKLYEFRRTIFKHPVNKVVVYASAPISKVIGEFEVDSILHHDLSTLWEKTESFAGIEKDFFFDYFDGKEHGYAIRIKKPKQYRIPRCIKSYYNIQPPQSFAYIMS